MKPQTQRVQMSSIDLILDVSLPAPARALPDSWRLPERMAARIMRMPVTSAAGITAPAWSTNGDAGAMTRSAEVVRRSTNALKKASCRSCAVCWPDCPVRPARSRPLSPRAVEPPGVADWLPVRASGTHSRRGRIGNGIKWSVHASLHCFQVDEALGGFRVKPAILHRARSMRSDITEARTAAVRGARSAGLILFLSPPFQGPFEGHFGLAKDRSGGEQAARFFPLETSLWFTSSVSPDAGNRVRWDTESVGSLRRVSCPNCSNGGFGNENQLRLRALKALHRRLPSPLQPARGRRARGRRLSDLRHPQGRRGQLPHHAGGRRLPPRGHRGGGAAEPADRHR